MKRLIVLLIMIASISSIGLSSNQAFAGNGPPTVDLGDYKCYDTFFDLSQIPNISLEDQFGEMIVIVEDIIRVCPPVIKSGQPPAEEFAGFPGSPTPFLLDQHFVVHEICDPGYEPPGCGALPPLGQTVILTDQFGSTLHQVMEPIELWVPAVKDDGNRQFPSGPVTNIHYKCYNIEPVDNPLGQLFLILNDQFDFSTDEILQADKLCNPVIKDIGGNGDEGTLDTEHLKCYKIIDDPLDNLNLAGFEFVDQFFFPFTELIIGEEHEVCLVADKQVLQLIGGSLIPIDSTSFLLAGAQIAASWMIPVVVAGIGIGFVVLRKFKN